MPDQAGGDAVLASGCVAPRAPVPGTLGTHAQGQACPLSRRDTGLATTIMSSHNARSEGGQDRLRAWEVAVAGAG